MKAALFIAFTIIDAGLALLLGHETRHCFDGDWHPRLAEWVR